MSKFVASLNVFVFLLTARMSEIMKEELVTILDEKLEEKFQRKFDELKQQIDHKLAPLQKMIDEVLKYGMILMKISRDFLCQLLKIS